MDVVLVMFREDGERRSFSLTRDVTLIGRREDADFRIPLTDVSRKHCRLIKDGNLLILEDLGSSNGTYHNGKRVQEAEINPGDTLKIGPVQFVVQIDGVPSESEIMGSGMSGMMDSGATLITPAPPAAPSPVIPPPPLPPGFAPPATAKGNTPTIDNPPEEVEDDIPGFEADAEPALHIESDDLNADAEVAADSLEDEQPVAEPDLELDLSDLDEDPDEAPAVPSETPARPAAPVPAVPSPSALTEEPEELSLPNEEPSLITNEADDAIVDDEPPAAPALEEDEFEFIDDAAAGESTEESEEDDVLIDFDMPDDKKKD
jgi:pSer/pThr/pTyr-binding forkhead associated (FHA) protein